MARREALDPFRLDHDQDRPEPSDTDDGPGSVSSPPPIRRDHDVPAVTGELAAPVATPFVPEFDSPSPKRRWLPRPSWVAEPRPITTKAQGGTVVTFPPKTAPDWQDATRVGGRVPDDTPAPRRRTGSPPGESSVESVEPEFDPLDQRTSDIALSPPGGSGPDSLELSDRWGAHSLRRPRGRDFDGRDFDGRDSDGRDFDGRDSDSGDRVWTWDSESGDRDSDLGELEAESELDALLAELSAVSSDKPRKPDRPGWWDDTDSLEKPIPLDGPSWFDDLPAEPGAEPNSHRRPDEGRPPEGKPRTDRTGNATSNPAPVRTSGGRPPPIRRRPPERQRDERGRGLAADRSVFPAAQVRPPGSAGARSVDRNGPDGGPMPDLADRFARAAGVRPSAVDRDGSSLASVMASLGPWPRRLAIGLTFLVIFIAALIIAGQVLG